MRRWNSGFAYENVKPVEPQKPAPALLFLQGAAALPNKPFIFIFPFSRKKYSVLLVHLARFVQTGGDSV